MTAQGRKTAKLASISRRWHPWLLLSLLLSGCVGDSGYEGYQGPIMGTAYRVSARCPQDVGPSIAQELASVDGQMSTYREDSQLSRFNAAQENRWVPVPPELLGVVAAAQRLSQLTDGAFDVTVGPLVNVWGFGPVDVDSVTPSPQALAGARARVGYHNLQVRESPAALMKLADIYVDLSAIAKGHGVDRVTEVLVAKGCTDFMVDVGGEVAVRGANPDGQPWRIGIEAPDTGKLGAVHRVLHLTDMAVATSGDYRNYFEEDGRRYSHTIDPRTGRPVAHALASVTVVHPLAMWADGYATAISVMGPDRGWKFAEAQELPVLMLVHGANGFVERYTSAMQPYL